MGFHVRHIDVLNFNFVPSDKLYSIHGSSVESKSISVISCIRQSCDLIFGILI